MFPLPPLLLGITPRPWSLLVLVARFFADMVVASIQVAYQAAAPWFHPHGYLVDVALRTDDDLFAMITAEMVALVPGTVVVAFSWVALSAVPETMSAGVGQVITGVGLRTSIVTLAVAVV